MPKANFTKPSAVMPIATIDASPTTGSAAGGHGVRGGVGNTKTAAIYTKSAEPLVVSCKHPATTMLLLGVATDSRGGCHDPKRMVLLIVFILMDIVGGVVDGDLL
eukprot:TRINITY_DN25027_c0_g1_i1.p2 TRINITY_DN25027_c0_g1~~TRINITY_DN25027_c0_g1_i1.p2  ORF type:complete len:105 (+),score=9.28 TRINITY_DN25027_c0_g1_i1:106-420(+)